MTALCPARVAPEKQTPRLPAAALFAGVEGEDMTTKMSYAEQLQHPNWQRKRLEVLDRAGYECASCGSKDKMLHVHHKRYIKGRMAWDYDEGNFEVLCKDCHKDDHDLRELLDRLMAECDSGASPLRTVVAMLSGYLDASVAVDPGLSRMGFEADPYFYDLGVLVSLANGADWSVMAKAARMLRPGSLSPTEQRVLGRWEGKD